MVWFFAMKRAVPPPTKRKPTTDSDWLKTPYPNLIRYKPSGNYFGRVRVNGKLIRRSLETHVLSVAKLKVSDFLQDNRRLTSRWKTATAWTIRRSTLTANRLSRRNFTCRRRRNST